jgi:hypothetical protein|tara:strand:- start:44 stop:268 length:225 start_codon:yes stop_codon:yes gene_type:complete
MNRDELIRECSMFFWTASSRYDEEVYFRVMEDIEEATVIVKGVACVGFHDNDDISVRDYAVKIMRKKMISLGHL